MVTLKGQCSTCGFYLGLKSIASEKKKNPFFCLSISSCNHLTAVFDFLPSVIIFLHLLFLIALCSSEYLSKGCISVHGLSCQMVELTFHLLVLLKSEQEKKKTLSTLFDDPCKLPIPRNCSLGEDTVMSGGGLGT